ncbi:MAG: Yip1 family protein [Mangrovibacterium sp.]
MKIKQLALEITQVCQQMVTSPKLFWQDKQENGIRHTAASSLYIFAVLLSSISAFLGNLMWSKAFLWSYAIGLSVRELIANILVWMLASFIIKKLANNYAAKVESGTVSGVLALSLLPAIVVSIIAHLFPGLYPLHILGLYGFYLFYQGANCCFNIPKENISRYVLLALVLIILISGLTYSLTWIVFKEIFPHGI